MRERERCGCLLSGTSRCTQLRRGMNQQHFDPFIWQNQTKAAHLVGKENSTQVLEEGQFQRETTGDTQPEDWQGAGNISATGYNRVHLCLTELRSFTQSVCLCRAVSEGTFLQRRWRGKDPRLSPTCSRSTCGANLNCWANSHCLQSTSTCGGRSFFQCFVFALEMFLVSQFNFYGRFYNLRWI